jgi:acetyl-CoA C-acetyltransferase
MSHDRTPVIVGVGEVVGDRQRDPANAREPLHLILDAVQRAAADTGGSAPVVPNAAAALLASVDAVYAIRTSSWAYDDAAARVGAAIGASPTHLVDTTVGGHWPARLLEQAAARIAAGEDRVGLLVGGEAQASVTALAKAGRDPVGDLGWSTDPGGPPAFDPSELGTPRMVAGGVVLPTRVYPLFHNALQADLGLTPAQAAARSARLYAALSAVAADNPVAWAPRRRTAEEIGTVGPGNRMVCEPYPLAVNAMPHVDQAVAVLVMSADMARQVGIPEDRWVHVWGGAGATDPADVLDRPDLCRSPALESALDRTLAHTGLTVSELDVVDVYSCFPVVPELVARHLGTGDRVLSATGGHAAFGGPLSSYSLHAVAAVAGRLRSGAARHAAVHANGGYLTEQHVIVLADRPATAGYAGDPDPVVVPVDPVPVADATDLLAETGGDPVPLIIESCTVEHGRDGRPALGIVIARTASGVRTAATTAPGDEAAAAALSLAALPEGVTTHVGRTVHLVAAGGGAAIAPIP